ncbi:sigma-70 family RNA polymerase sigma factor [Aeromicrobium sp.]|uniref:RNA polymerase sigma factor n=1 Tax=Aeromicrobium sp. TaxID=1871063 RepID=UPI0030BAD7DA
MDDDGPTQPSDGDLVMLTRGGSVEAYAVLFERHAPALRAMGRRIVRPSDVDDVVAEAFAATLDQLRHGRGPTTSVRGYLLTALRHEAGRRAAGHRRLVLVEDVETYDCVVERVDTAFDHEDVTTAYRALPARWQFVLWQLEVEGRRPQDLAGELGLTPNAVSALGLRARAGLRKAYRDHAA